MQLFTLRVIVFHVALDIACAGNSASLRQLYGLPNSQRINNKTLSEPMSLVIRHDLPGTIFFRESNYFWIDINITGEETGNASMVKIVYRMGGDNKTIALQVYKESEDINTKEITKAKARVVFLVVLCVGGFVGVCLFVSLLVYLCYWKKRSEKTDEDGNDDQRNEDPIPRTFSQKRRYYDSSTGTTATICSVMLLAVCTCAVQAQFQTVRADIVVYFPRGFIGPESSIFFNSLYRNKLEKNGADLGITVYDVPSAGLQTKDRCQELNLTCERGACDPMRGRCTCPRGMKIHVEEGRNPRCVYKCHDSCSEGHFEQSPCNQTNPGVCKKCRPLCSFSEFESTPCAGKSDRNCTDISKLPKIRVSTNLAFENRLRVKDSVKVKQTIFNYSDQYSIWLNRTSGLGLNIRVLHVDFSSTFREVLHNVSDNDQLQKDADSLKIRSDLCGFPVPDYYEIELKKSGRYVANMKGTSTACPNYEGKQKLLPKAGQGLHCFGSDNPILRLFGEKCKVEGLWKEEETKACFEYKKKCQKCREQCTVSVRKDPVCNITRDDRDKKEYGEHFTYCFECCFQTSCACKAVSCPCDQYKKKKCLTSQVTCLNMTDYHIPIKPVFQNKVTFKCHVTRLRGPVFALEASLWKDGKLIRDMKTGEKNRSKETAEKRSRDFGYMILRHPSILHKTVSRDILIKGGIHEAKFAVGWYKNNKHVFSAGKKKVLQIQPKMPFGVNTKTWPKQKCESVNKEHFVVLPFRDENFQEFPNMSAEIDWEDRRRVYKVYNSTTRRVLEFEIPENRSVFQYSFPETVIVNDNTLIGKLLRNRTFWTIRLSGRVTTCPGFFSVELTDQDKPQVKIYHADIGVINNICTFTIEFSLPSGGNTGLIDKTFTARLTDSKKNLKLILVSPRLAPDFSIPDLEEDFDIEKLEVLIPIGAATGGMIVVLILILIYGYKTKPRDKYQRDRDNKLHLRHVLFLVWFVGMRLGTSLFVTLTVFSVTLSAIHHANVNTLQRYTNFHKEHEKVEKGLMSLMEEHKVQEINRQLALLQDGKSLCDLKIKDLEIHLKQNYDEMRRRQEGERRGKSIIFAAKDRIRKQIKETKERFEDERVRINEAMDSSASQLNARVRVFQHRVDGNFWLKAAHALYDTLNALASIFGGIKKPFIQWVGLHVNFPEIDFSLGSFNDVFEDFEDDLDFGDDTVGQPNASYAKKIIRKDLDINIHESIATRRNISSHVSKERVQELLALDWIIQFVQSRAFTGILLLIDLLMFVYRHCKTYQLAVVLLHGLPKIHILEEIQKADEKREKKKETQDEKERKKAVKEMEQMTKLSEEGSNFDRTDRIRPAAQYVRRRDDNEQVQQDALDNSAVADKAAEESPRKKAIHASMGYLDQANSIIIKVLTKLKELNYQINNTDLVPVCIMVVTGLLSIYVVIVTAKYALNAETLEAIGYFDVKLAPLLTMRKIVNTRITSNAFLVNEVHIPYYDRRVNARIAFFKKKVKMYQAYQCARADLHNEEYCSWVGDNCQRVGTHNENFLINLTKFECHIEPVLPHRFTKFDTILYKENYKQAIQPYVAALRSLIIDTFYTLLVVVGISVVLKLLGTAIFVLLKKFDLIRQVKHYQTDYRLVHGKYTKPHCLRRYVDGDTPREIGPVQIPDAIKEKCGVAIREGTRSVWVE